MRPVIGSGDLVAFNDGGKSTRGIVVGRPVSGTLKIDVPAKARPVFRAADEVELLVKAGYDIEAETPAIATTVAIILEGGLVRDVRASAPLSVEIIDLDTFDNCYGDEDSLCQIEESDEERREHGEVRQRYEDAQALPVEAY